MGAVEVSTEEAAEGNNEGTSERCPKEPTDI